MRVNSSCPELNELTREEARMDLTIHEVSVSYGRKNVVDGVSLRLHKGLHALLGQNGAGKTSLIETVATLRKPAGGSISLQGATWPGDDPAQIRRCLGYLPQENLGKSRLTVREHLEYMCWLGKLAPQSVSDEVDRVIDLIDLGEQSHSAIRSLSGGMRRRVGIGSALVGRPGLIVLDEPSAGLDLSQREGLRDIMRKAADDAIVIVSTHIVEDVLDVADTITVLNEGKVLRHCPREDFSPVGDLAAFENEYLRLVNR